MQPTDQTTAMQSFYAVALTAPMRVKEIAEFMDLDPDTVAKALQDVPGAVRFGSLWQVPVHRMGPQYWRENGLVPEHIIDETPLETDRHL